jgi:hypothetical protein
MYAEELQRRGVDGECAREMEEPKGGMEFDGKPLKWMAGLRKAANRQTAAGRESMERASSARSKDYYDTRQEDWDR